MQYRAHFECIQLNASLQLDDSYWLMPSVSETHLTVCCSPVAAGSHNTNGVQVSPGGLSRQ